MANQVYDEFIRQGVFFGYILSSERPPESHTDRFCFYSDPVDIWTPADPIIVMKLIILGFDLAKSIRSDGDFNTHLRMLKSIAFVPMFNQTHIVRWHDSVVEGTARSIALRKWLVNSLANLNFDKLTALEFHKLILLINSKEC